MKKFRREQENIECRELRVNVMETNMMVFGQVVCARYLGRINKLKITKLLEKLPSYHNH